MAFDPELAGRLRTVMAELDAIATELETEDDPEPPPTITTYLTLSDGERLLLTDLTHLQITHEIE